MPETFSGGSEKHNQGDGGPEELLSHTSHRILPGHQPRTHIQSKLLVSEINAAAERKRVSACIRTYFQIEVSNRATHALSTGIQSTVGCHEVSVPPPFVLLWPVLIVFSRRGACSVSAEYPWQLPVAPNYRRFTRIHTRQTVGRRTVAHKKR